MTHPTSAPSIAAVDPHTLKQWLHDGREIALLDVEHGQYGESICFSHLCRHSRLEMDIVRLAPRHDVRVVVYDERRR